MKVFRVALIAAWLVVAWFTVVALKSEGLSGGKVFFTDFSSPWRAQINGDFCVHLFLAMSWIAYRERTRLRGVVLAVPAVLGSLYLLPYILVATFRSKAGLRGVVYGDRALSAR